MRVLRQRLPMVESLTRRVKAPIGKSLGLIIVAALLIRLMLFAAAACCPERYLRVDSHKYLQVSQDLGAAYLDVNAQTFGTALHLGTGYVLFLAALRALRASLPFVLLVQILLGVGTVYLLSRQRALFGSGAMFAAALLAIEPASSLHANVVLSETLFTLLVAGAVLLLLYAIRRRLVWLFFASGLLFAAASFTRAIGLYLPLLLVPPLLWLLRHPGGRRILLVAAFMAGYALPIGSWIAKNYSLTGVAMFSAIQGQNVEYRAAGALASATGMSVRDAREEMKWGLAEFACGTPVEREPRVEPCPEFRQRVSNPALRSQLRQAYGLSVLRQHPGGALRSAAAGFSRTVFDPGTRVFKGYAGIRSRWLVLGSGALVLGMTVVIYAFAGRGAWSFARDGDWSTFLVLVVSVLYLIGAAAGPEGQLRFRIPAIPLLCLLAGRGYVAGHGRLAAAKSR